MSNNENTIIQLLHQLQKTESFEANEEAIAKEYFESNLEKHGLAIKVLSVLGGILGTLAFIGFLFIAGLYNSSTALVIAGVLFIVTAVFINKQSGKLVLDTATICIFLSGFFLAGYGLEEMKMGENTTALIFIFIALVTLAVMQRFMLSLVAMLIINGCFLFLIFNNNYDNLIHIYISLLATVFTCYLLNEAALITSNPIISALYKPMRTALMFSFITAVYFVGKKGWVHLSPSMLWLSALVSIGITLFLVTKKILPVFNITDKKTKTIVYIMTLAILLPTLFAPAVSGALMVLLLSFFVDYKTGIVTGILSLIYFVSQYYYDLNLTLLVKSGILFTSGLLLIFFYFITNKINTNANI